MTKPAKSSSSLLFCLGLLLLVLVCQGSMSLYAQNTGSILGTVHDVSGAAIPAAAVSVTNVATGTVRTFQTLDAGDYEVPSLPPGTYAISVTKAGFATTSLSGIVLQVDQRARVDVTMNVGSVRESVTVQAGALMLSTDSPELGTVIENQRVTDLPLNGRSFLTLTLLVPGATSAPRSSGAAFEDGAAISVDGVRAEYNNFTLDGVDNNVITVGSQAVNPSIDSIQEFKVLTGTYSAAFGRSGGGQINIATKSGTNNYHGTLFEFLRNNDIQARNYFDKGAPGPYKQNQFGFSLGGPVSVPRLYNGKNRSFFFANYDGTRIRQANPTLALVPTATERTGDLSSLGVTIVDPYTGIPFTGNQIPSSRIDPIAAKVLALWPTPNTTNPNAALNYSSDLSVRNDIDQYTIRGDQYVGTKDQLFIRYTHSDRGKFSPGYFSNVGGESTIDPDLNIGAGWMRIFSPTRLLDVHFGYNGRNSNNVQQNSGVDYAKQLGLPMLSTIPSDFGFPQFLVGSFTTFGDQLNDPRPRLDRAVQGSANFTLIHGRHTLNMGTEYRWQNIYNAVAQQRRGVYSFTDGIFTGSAFGNFLLGLPTNTTISNPALVVQNVSNAFDSYIQDDWRIANKLTFNVGMRYSNSRPWHASNTKESSFDPSTGQVVTLCTDKYPCGLYYPSNTGFAPRLGFAYSPTASNRIVIRGGYGIFWASESGNPVFDQGQNPPYGGYAFNYQANSNQPGFLTLENPFPGTLSAGAPADPTLFVMDLHYHIPYVQQRSFGIQVPFGNNWLAEFDYMGSKTTHILTTFDFNQPLPGAGAVQPRRRYPNYGVINYSSSFGDGNYNGLGLKLERRFSSGFSLLVGYTFAKSIDNEGIAWGRPQNSYNFRAERGVSDFNVKHRLVTSFVYDLPLGKGRRFGANASGIGDALIGGWQIDAIETSYSGLSYSPTLNYDVANVGLGEYTARPNRVGDGNKGSHTVSQWWNPSAFAAPAQYAFGNAGRNSLVAPGFSGLDLSLVKGTNLTESTKLEFRAEAFNAFNQTSFETPNATALTPLFGVISSAQAPRIFQFALKIYF